MTSRPRGKRDQRTSDTPRAAKGGPSGSAGSSGKRSGGGGRGRKPSGKASQRPPRVSRPPTVSDKPKKTTRASPPAKPAAAPKKPAARSTRSRGQQSAQPTPQQTQEPVMRAPAQPPAQPPAPTRQQRPQNQQQQSPRTPAQHGQPPRGEPRPPMPERGPAPMPPQTGRAPAPPQGGQRGPGGGQQQQQQYQQRPPMPTPMQGQRGAPQQGRPPAPAPMHGGQQHGGQRPMQGPPQGQRPQGQHPSQQSQRGPGYGAPQGGPQRPMGQQPMREQPMQQQPRGPMPPQSGHGGQRGPGGPSGAGGPPMGQQPRAPMPPQQQGQRPFDQPRGQQGPGGPPRDQRGMMPPGQRPPQAPLQPAMRESRPAPQPQEMSRPPAPPQPPVQRQPERPAQPPVQQQQRPQQGQRPPQRPVMPMQGQPSNLYAPSPRPAPRPAPQPAPMQRPPAAPQAPARPQPPVRDQAPVRQQPQVREPARPEQPSRDHGTQNGAPAILQPRPESRTVEPKPSATPHAPAEGNVKPFPGKQDDVFDKTVRFADLGLSPEALEGVTDAGFEFPTAIQAKIIPLLLTGKDILGQAKTGTGKTAAFGLPMLSRLRKGDALSAIVLVPTRELAIQVATDLTELGRHTGLTVLPVYGGQNIATQADRLRRGPEIIVATPGRLMDMAQRGYLHYHNIRIAILDEVDRMLDIGFRDDIRKILSACPKDRQTVFVSATLPPEVESLARSYARDAEKIVATTGSLTASMVRQFHLTVEPWDKKQLLLHLLTHEQPALTIVFCRTKKTVDNLAEYMFRKGIDAHAIHGDMYQTKRNKVIEKLKSGKLSVLIASDLASRGLDVEGITHVINYDLPEDPDLYVHRIGRTARAGHDGVAWSLVTPEQGELLTQIEMLINAEIPKLDYPDFKPGPLPQDILASRELDAKRAAVAKTFNRFATTGPGTIGHVASTSPADADPSKFPGGIVPSKLPERRLGGKVRTARSMKQAIAQTLMPGTQPKPAPEDGAPAAPAPETPA